MTKKLEPHNWNWPPDPPVLWPVIGYVIGGIILGVALEWFLFH